MVSAMPEELRLALRRLGNRLQLLKNPYRPPSWLPAIPQVRVSLVDARSRARLDASSQGATVGSERATHTRHTLGAEGAPRKCGERLLMWSRTAFVLVRDAGCGNVGQLPHFPHCAP
eukprot:1727331-Rhodomonas_salina.1